MKQAQEERKAGQQVLVSRMNKNKKFQKEQLAKEGYEEIVEFLTDKKWRKIENGRINERSAQDTQMYRGF